MSSKTLDSVCPTLLAIHGIPCTIAPDVSSQECHLQTMRDIQKVCLWCDSADLTNHKSYQKPCEPALTDRGLIEVWSQAMIQRELARKTLAYVEEAFDDYVFEIRDIFREAQYNQFLEKYLNVIQRAGTSTTMKW